MIQKQIIIKIENILGSKVKSYKIIEDNDNFIKLKNNIESYLNNYNLDSEVKINFLINESLSFQKTDDGLEIILHNSILISTHDGINLRFYPHSLEGLELGFNFVNISIEDNKNKLVLLNTFFEFVREVLVRVPKIFIREIDFEYNT